jgi:hypothetical protein
MYDPIGSRDINEFYELREKVSVPQNTLRDLIKTDPDRAEAYAIEHEEELMLAAMINGAVAKLADTRQYKKYLSSDLAAKELSHEERRQRTDEVRKMEQELTGWVMEAAREAKRGYATRQTLTP